MKRNIFVSTLDYSRLHDLVITARQFATSKTDLLESLERELAAAQIVRPDEIPPYIVAMNTCVHLADLATGEESIRSIFSRKPPSNTIYDHGRSGRLAS